MLELDFHTKYLKVWDRREEQYLYISTLFEDSNNMVLGHSHFLFLSEVSFSNKLLAELPTLETLFCEDVKEHLTCPKPVRFQKILCLSP